MFALCKDNLISLKLNRIRCLPSLKDVIGFGKSILCRSNNSHRRPIRKQKHLVFGDTTGLAKVSRVHCRSRPGLPILASSIRVKHLKQIFCNKTKTPRLLFFSIMVIYYHMSSQRAFVRWWWRLWMKSTTIKQRYRMNLFFVVFRSFVLLPNSMAE